MVGPTMKFRASFRTARRAAQASDGRTNGTPGSRRSRNGSPGPSRAARLLALAHYVDRQFEAGVFRSYGDAARKLGITPGRMTQVMNLLLLAPTIQERVLSGELRCGERGLRSAAGLADWEAQARQLRESD